MRMTTRLTIVGVTTLLGLGGCATEQRQPLCEFQLIEYWSGYALVQYCDGKEVSRTILERDIRKVRHQSIDVAEPLAAHARSDLTDPTPVLPRGRPQAGLIERVEKFIKGIFARIFGS